MHAQPNRQYARDPREPLLFELDPIRCDGDSLHIRVQIHHADDGMWRGRMLFRLGHEGEERATAEIFCGASERDLWESIQGLREHHLRDLYRSLG